MATEIFSLVGRIALQGSEKVTKTLADTEQKAKTTAGGIGNLGQTFQKVGGGLKDFGANMSTYVTLPLAGLGTLSVMTAAQFDDSMRAVSAAMGDKLGSTVEETAKNFEMLKEQAIILGSTTAFSATEAAEGMKALAQSGWDTNQIMKGTGDMLNLASAGAMELGETADIVTNLMSSFAMGADETGRAVDVLAIAASNSPATVYDMGESYKYAGAAAAAAGMDIEETTSVLATFGEAGIVGSTAGTMLGSMLSDVQSKAKNSAVQIGKTKVAVYDSSGAMRDMTSIMEDVEKATGKMTDAERDRALQSVFGIESMRGVNIMLGQGTEKTRELEKAMRNGDGAAADMAETMESGIGGTLRNMEGALERASIVIGDVLAPAVQTAADYVTELTNKFSSLSPSTQQTIVMVAAIVAGIAPLITGLGLLINLVGSSVLGFGKLAPVLGFIASPAGLITAAIAALAAGLIYAYNNSETFREAVNQVFTTLAPKVMAGVSAAANFIRQIWGSVTAWWTANGDMILQAITNVFNFMLPIVSFVMTGLMNTIQMYWGIIKNIFSGALNMILGLVSLFGAVFSGNWGKAWDAVKQIFSGAVQMIWGLIQLWFMGKIIAIVGGFASRFVGFFRTLASGARTVWSGLVTQITGFVTRIGTAITSKISAAVTSVARFFAKLSTDAGLRFLQVANLAKSGFNKVKDFILNPIKDAVTKVKGHIDTIKGYFTKLKLKLPKFEMPPLPHIKLETGSKTVMGKKITYPTGFDVEWYDRGGIFNSPSIIGVGERRPEFVGALDDLRQIVREEAGGAGGSITVEIPLYLEGLQIARAVAPHIDTELARRQQQDARNRGRRI